MCERQNRAKNVHEIDLLASIMTKIYPVLENEVYFC